LFVGFFAFGYVCKKCHCRTELSIPENLACTPAYKNLLTILGNENSLNTIIAIKHCPKTKYSKLRASLKKLYYINTEKWFKLHQTSKKYAIK
jgi:hypothetical protein